MRRTVNPNPPQQQHTFTKVNKMPNTSSHGKCVNELLEEIMNAMKMEKHL